MKDYFTFYRSYRKAIRNLPVPDRVEIYEAIIDYALDNKEPHLTNETTEMVFDLISPTLIKSKILSKNGSKGGAPKGNKNASKKTTKNN